MNKVLGMVVAGVAALSSSAATWMGNGLTADWTDGANWDVAPVGGEALVFDGDKNLAPVNDFAAGMTFSGITFGAGASAFTLSGNGLLLTGNLVNNSPVTQTLNLPVTIDANRTFNAAEAPIVFGGLTNLSYSGSGTKILSKQGEHELVFTGTSVMPYSNDNRMEILNGTLRFAQGSVFTVANTGTTREFIQSGTPNGQSQKARVVIEKNALVTLGNFNVQIGGVAGNTFDMLIDGGRLFLPGGDNSFGDSAGSTISLSILNGGMLTNNAGMFNVGTRSPMTIDIDNGSFYVSNLCFGRDTGSGGRPTGRSVINLNEGLVFVAGQWAMGSTDDAARTNVVTVGDGRVGKATFSVGSVTRANENPKNILNINGGTMAFRSTVTLPTLQGLNIFEGGARLDVASGTTVTIGAAVSRADALAPGVSDGGVTKRGAGTLLLTASANTFGGPLRVEGGTLRISGTLPPAGPKNIVAAEGTTLSFRGASPQTFQPDQLSLGGVSADTVLELDVNADGSDPDILHLPLDTTIGRLNVRLYERNTEAVFTGQGDIVLFTYTSEPPDVSLWTHGNLAAGQESQFIVDRSAKTITLRITGIPEEQITYEWLNPLGGNWDIPGNWQGNEVPPDSPLTWCRLWGVLSTPSTVFINREISTRGFSLRGGNAYTVSGPGPLNLINTDYEPQVVSDTGSHTVDVPLNLTRSTYVGASESATRLQIDNVISGTGPLRIERAGTVGMSGANTFTGGLTLSAGRFEPASADVFGTGPLTLGGGTLAALGTMQVANTWAVTANTTIQVADGETFGLGDLSAYANNVNLYKTGPGTLNLYGTGNIPNNAVLRPREGTTRITSGASYTFLGTNRDTVYMEGLSASTAVAFEILPGAYLRGGLHTMQGIHSFLIDGGTFETLTETALSDTANSILDIRITNGGILQQVSGQQFSIGMHGPCVMTVDDHGTVSAARVTFLGNSGDVGNGGNRAGTAVLNVSDGGTFEARENFTWLSSMVPGKTGDLNILTGGQVTIPATQRNSGSLGYGIATLTLDGGELVCSGLPLTQRTDAGMTPASLANYFFGLDHFALGANGGTIDTRLNDITVTQTLTDISGAPLPGTLTKRGPGSLTLAGGADTISLAIEGGVLAIGGAPTFADVTLADGAAFAASGTWTVQGALTIGSDAGIRLDFQQTPGTHTLATFSTLAMPSGPPRIINPLPGHTYAVAQNGSTLEVTIGAPPVDVTWAADANGPWGTPSSWTPNNVPDGTGHVATFTDIFTAPRLVTLGTPPTLSGLLFDAAEAPLLQGAPLTFTPAAGVLPGIRVIQGAPAIDAEVNLPGATAVTVAGGASLTLADTLNGTGPLALTGGGTLILAGTNSATPIEMEGATLGLTPLSSQLAPVVVGPRGATVGLTDGTAVTLGGPVTGSGALTKAGNGTLALPSLPPVDLALGGGTLALTSTVAQVWGGVLRTGTDGGITILRNAGDITLAGPVSGATRFIKTGPGTLTYTYPGAMTLAANLPALTQDVVFNIGSNGEAPTQGPRGYNILDGTVVIGVPGQTIAPGVDFLVGAYTTDVPGAETEAHLVINGGTVSLGAFYIGRGNGSAITAPTPLRSSVTVNDGTVTLTGTIQMGSNGGIANGTLTAKPEFTLNGGTVTVAGASIIADASGCEGTLTINGGALTFNNNFTAANSATSVAHITITDGSLYTANALNLASNGSSTGTLHIAGGTVDVQNVTGSGYGRVLFDGGVYRGRSGPMSAPKEAQILAGGMRVDSPANGYTINMPFTDAGLPSDAGFTKTGPGYLRLSQPMFYKGPTAVEEGELQLDNAAILPATTTLAMAPGTAFTPEIPLGGQSFAFTGLTLGAPNAEPVSVKLYFAQSFDRFDVSGPVTLGDVAFTLYNAGTTFPVQLNGAYTLITYTGADPDISGLSVANALESRDYIFSVDSVNKRVVLTIDDTASTGSSFIWAVGNGNWSTGTSWLNGAAPLATAKTPTFPWQGAPVTVTIDTAATVGGLAFNGDYTLDGANTLTLDAPQPIISGGATLRAPLQIAGVAETFVQPNGGRLTVGNVSGPGAALSLNTAGQLRTEGGAVEPAVNLHDGTLEIGDNADIQGEVQYFAGTITALGDGQISGTVALQFGQKQINPASGKTLTLAGPVLGNAALVVNGAGRVELAAANTYTGGTAVQAGTLALRAPATTGNGDIALVNTTLATVGTDPVAIASSIVLSNNNATLNFDAPLTTTGNLSFYPAATARLLTKNGPGEFAFGGRFYFSSTSGNGTRVNLNNGIFRFLPGSSYTFIEAIGTGADGTGTGRTQFNVNMVANGTGGITIEDGAEVALGSLSIRSVAATGNNSSVRLLMNGGSLTLHSRAPLCLGDQNAEEILVEINDGILRAVEDDSWTDIGTRTPVYWVMNGGTVSLGRAAFGRGNSANSNRLNGRATLVISNGVWEARTGFSWKSTDYASAVNSVTLGCGEPLQGVFSVPPTVRYHAGGTATFNQNGGILRMLPVFATGGNFDMIGSPADFLSTINAWNVGPGGAAFDVPDEESDFTITQAMTLAPDHGGVTKLGPGTLTLAQALAVTGAVTVAEGTLKASVTSVPDLRIGADGCLDLAAGTSTFRDVSGAGTATNGTLAVSGALSPGDDSGEPGIFHAENLTFKSGSTYRYDWTESANDLFAVSGTIAKEGPVTVDFGMEENALDAITIPFTCVLGTYGNVAGTFSGGWKVINTGFPSRIALNAVVTADNGIVTMKITSGGTVLIVR